MIDNELNIKGEDSLKATAVDPSLAMDEDGEDEGISVFKFAVRPVVISVMQKWKWIVLTFVSSVIVFWFIFHYIGNYSEAAWSANAKIFHQTRSDKIPTFYKPMETSSIMQFITSQNVFGRVAEMMKSSNYVFTRSMLNNCEVTVGKGRQNIITVTASASTPEAAAAIANAVAEEGVHEYSRRQNSSVRIMIDEREKQKSDITRELVVLADRKKQFHSPETGFSPAVELEKLYQEITVLTTKAGEVRMKLSEIEIRLNEVVVRLDMTDEQVPFETTEDNTKGVTLDGKKAELSTLQRRYTDENPKVKILKEEIAEIERKMERGEIEKTSSKVVYRKNVLYSELETQKMQLGIDKIAVASALESYEKEIERKRAQITNLLEINEKYSDLVRRENILLEKAAKLDDGISDLEFLISSAVPDIYVFEHAMVPRAPNLRKMQAKVAIFSILTTFLVAAGFAGVRIGKMRMLDSSEFASVLGIRDLGEIPSSSEVPETMYSSAISAFQQLTSDDFLEYKNLVSMNFGSVDYEKNMTEIIGACAIRGLNIFRLKCVPATSQDSTDTLIPEEDDEIAQGLISVSKHLNNGVFVYRNEYSLDTAETDLLKFDLSVLNRNYDIVIIESIGKSANYRALVQLSAIVDGVLMFVPFDEVSKVDLLRLVKHIKASSSAEIGGLLFNIPKSYYKK